MNMSSKTIIAVTILCAGLAQVNAKDTSRSQEGPPPRPLFSDIDSNGDGDIDFDEFSARKVPKEVHQHIFSQIDQDNNGVISKTEFVNHKPPKGKGRK